jgi:hypothetical protein
VLGEGFAITTTPGNGACSLRHRQSRGDHEIGCTPSGAGAEGTLMSYGPDASDIFRRSTSYVDRILKGAKPADLPVQTPTKFELVINLKTAKYLAADVAGRAEVIE